MWGLGCGFATNHGPSGGLITAAAESEQGGGGGGRVVVVETWSQGGA